MLGLEDIAAVLYGHVLQKVCDDVKKMHYGDDSVNPRARPNKVWKSDMRNIFR